jgi:uncharacterized protein (TIGR02996 family)
MTHEEAFLEAIGEAPEDDAPRLIYADWLEEGAPAQRGGESERAEFIRVQCELARQNEEAPGWQALKEREQALLARHRADWLRPVDRYISDAVFRRGFVERCSMGARRFLDYIDEVLRWAPLQELKLLRINQTHEGPERVARAPQLVRFRRLDLNGSHLGDQSLSTILSSPHLRGMRTLLLGETGLERNSIGSLSNPALAGLVDLDLSGNFLLNRIRLLTDTPFPFRLEALHLEDCSLTTEDAELLLAWSGLGTVQRLTLSNNPFRVTVAGRLARSPHTEQLQQLRMANAGVRVRGAQALASSDRLLQLTALDLSGNYLGISGIRALVGAQGVQRLAELRLDGNAIGPQGAEMLARWSGLDGVRELSLIDNNLGDEGVEALLRSRHLGQVRRLRLDWNNLGNASCQSLAECSHLGELRELSISWNSGIKDAGVRALRNTRYLPHLRVIDVLGLPGLRAEHVRRLEERYVVRR